MACLIDTDVMIDVSRENPNAATYLDSLSDPAISIVTAQELIAATAIERDFALVSRNRKHFAMIDGLRLEAPRY
jgi:predicted nucleic acid-binding protein